MTVSDRLQISQDPLQEDTKPPPIWRASRAPTSPPTFLCLARLSRPASPCPARPTCLPLLPPLLTVTATITRRYPMTSLIFWPLDPVRRCMLVEVPVGMRMAKTPTMPLTPPEIVEVSLDIHTSIPRVYFSRLLSLSFPSSVFRHHLPSYIFSCTATFFCPKIKTGDFYCKIPAR